MRKFKSKFTSGDSKYFLRYKAFFKTLIKVSFLPLNPGNLNQTTIIMKLFTNLS